jgi:hypothetical protein
MKNISSFILIAIFLSMSSINCFAETKSSRWIDLEWDEVEGSKGYDIELFEVLDKKEFSRGIFHTETPHWSKETIPGRYNVKIRAIDQRKVPGAWGEPIPVTIKLSSTQLLRPMQDEVFSTSEISDLIITFEWSHVAGAQLYQIIGVNSNNSIIFNEVTKEIQFKTKLNNIDNYKWMVIPLFNIDDKKEVKDILLSKDETMAKKSFIIKGQALKRPNIDIEIVKNRGFIFRWAEVFKANNYTYEVFKDEDNKELKKILSGNTSKKLWALGKEKLQNGTYVISIKAQAKDFQDSDNARITIRIDKDRLEVLNNESINKESSTRTRNASSLVGSFGYPNFTYSTKYYETDTYNEQSLRGVRVDGKWSYFLKNSSLQNNLNFSFSQVADTYFDGTISSITDSIGKSFIFSNFQIFASFGLRVDSFPIIYADRINVKLINKNGMTLAPELNLDVGYELNNNTKIHFQTVIFSPLLAIKLPNNPKLVPSLGFELGLKGTYTLFQQLDLFSGINRIEHTFKHYSIVNDSSFALEGDIDIIKYKSTYLIFGMEFFY